MSYENRIKSKLCKCGREQLMTGHHSIYNAKLKDGTQCCSLCKLDEIYNHAAKGCQQPEVAND